MVVDEGAVEDEAVVRFEGARDDVGGIRVRAAINGRAETSFRVGFDGKTAKVRNSRINLARFFSPPIGDSRIEWIEGVKPADDFRTAEINGERKLNAPRTKSVCDSNKLREMVVVEKMRVGVHVVDGAPIDADGSKNARVSGNAGKIGADATVFKKDGTARVTTLDAAIEIVPLVHPADGGVGLL